MRNSRGSSIIELAATVFSLTIMVLVSVDCAVVVYATATHDRCCREATRAASLSNSQTDAFRLAQAALSACQTDGYWVSKPTASASDLTFQDFGGLPNPTQVPTVSLATHCNIRLPVMFKFANAFFGTSDGLIHSTCRYVFPLTNLKSPVPPAS